MVRRTFTPTRLIMVLLVVGLALGIGLAVAQTQSAARPSADTPKSVGQTQEAAQPSGDTPGSAAEKPADTPETPAASAEEAAATAEAAAEDGMSGRTLSRMRSTTQAMRNAAVKRAAGRSRDSRHATRQPAAALRCSGAAAGTSCAPDYFTFTPNYATSALPVVYNYAPLGVPGTGVAQTGIHKFVDGLAGLGPANQNNLGHFIPIAAPKTNVWAADQGTFAGDYYEIGVADYNWRFHTDLPAVGSQVRGYADMNTAPPVAFGNASSTPTPHYLGPLIIAKRNVPVRIKFTNNLTAFSSYFIPADNTYMGMTHDENGTITNYSQNRATLHLHGGATPWISDGTPHQWTVPAGEFIDPPFKNRPFPNTNLNFPNRGDSTQFVPDMFFDATTHLPVRNIPSLIPPVTPVTDPGNGSMTFYYTNDQSSRLMFYHDHSWGTTRLNVYAGEAAGYLLHEDVTDALIGAGLPNNAGVDATTDYTGTPLTFAAGGVPLTAANGGLYQFGIPLIIQDKTFVPPDAQLTIQDPTWNWGPEGNLWFPHVYMPNQNPNDDAGASISGRWDLGAWFWPPMTATSVAHLPIACTGTGDLTAYPTTPPPICPPTPNPSGVPESFLDTPVINGVAYPTVTLHNEPYRFQMLNAANDRMFNMSLFYAADANGNVCSTAYTGPNNLGQASVPPTNPALCTEVKMVPAVPHVLTPITDGDTAPGILDDPIPACAQTTPDTLRGAGYLVMVNEALGLGTTAGARSNVSGLPIGCWPTSWPTDGRDGGVPDPLTAGPYWVQIGTEGGLLPAPVLIPPTPVGYNYNRRDVVVTNVQEHALFLGPAERADVVADFSNIPTGSTLILYNDSPAPVPGYDVRLDYYTGNPDLGSTGGAPSTLPGFGPNIRTMMQINIAANPSTTLKSTGYALATLQTSMPGIFKTIQPPIIVAELNYKDPKVGVARPLYPAAALPTGTLPGQNAYPRIGDMQLTFQPPVPGGTTYAPAITLDLKPKAIHELFETDYGKMNSILAEEIPLTNYNNQTTIPLAFVDPPTDFVANGETQLWKVTHNGVDSHSVHFHLFNVQLINRVGWDGAIRPPDPNEIGWKETVRMNPLEDAFVALKPVEMTLPPGTSFGVPESRRLYDPSRNAGATNVAGMPGFTNVDPNGNPLTIVNAVDSFGWEYVWHCHLLGHEESDMMRPIVFQIGTPAAPDSMVAKVNGLAGSQTVTLTWKYVQGGTPGLTFLLRKATNGGPWVNLVAPVLNTTSTAAGTITNYTYTDVNALPGATISYQVFAFNGNAMSGPAGVSATTLIAVAPPTNLVAIPALITTTSVTLTWSSAGVGVSNYTIWRALNPGPGALVATCPAASKGAPYLQQGGATTGTNYRNTGLITKTNYCYVVYANYPTGFAPAGPIAVTTK